MVRHRALLRWGASLTAPRSESPCFILGSHLGRSFSTGKEAAESGGSSKEIDFTNAQLAFSSKSTAELFRAWLVFRVCALGPVVRHCDSLYAGSVRFLGPSLTHGVLRRTFFNHFCAGEDVAQITPRMAELRKLGVGGILDYAAEAKEGEMPVAVQPIDEASTVGAPLSSRTYDYRGEAICEANADIFLDAVRAVKDATPDGFAAIKLSGLGDPVLLERMSTCLVEIARLFKKISGGGADDSSRPYHCLDRTFKLNFDAFSEGWKRTFTVKSEEELRQIFQDLDADKDGFVTYLEWSSSIRLSEINNLVRGCRERGPLSRAALNEEEIVLYRNMINRVRRIMDLAQSLGVRVMVDAEWVDIQPAIDHIVLFLQRIYNTGEQPIVFNTYQTYLKGMDGKVLRDLARSESEGWRYGAKLVRGAYMVSERLKAEKRGMESPVCETYEATEANFHACLDAILSHSAKSKVEGRSAAEVLVASHNRGSIERALKMIEELGVDRSKVYFGQLLGMADHLTFTLGGNGYKAYKYVPYGPIAEVVPYLIRRTQENSAILGSPGVQEERRMVGRELWRRLTPF